jgi:biopolymer transport protein ExbD
MDLDRLDKGLSSDSAAPADLLNDFDFLDSDDDAMGGIDITPMVDVIFILLVFFLCVSQLKTGRLKIKVPATEKTAATEEPGDTQRKSISVEVGQDGTISIAQRPCQDLTEVRKVIDELIQKQGKDQPILFRGDKRANYGRALQVLALINNAGLEKVEFEVEPGNGETKQ